jgi:hypothetical protein
VFVYPPATFRATRQTEVTLNASFRAAETGANTGSVQNLTTATQLQRAFKLTLCNFTFSCSQGVKLLRMQCNVDGVK